MGVMHSKVRHAMRNDHGGPAPSFLLAPWLGAATTALEGWVGFWTALMPREQAGVFGEFQRQALRAWTAPLDSWAAATGAPARHAAPRPAPVTAPVPERIELPRTATPPVAMPAAEPAAAPEAVPAPAPAEPARAAKPGRAAQLRQAPPRKAGPRKAAAAKTAPRKAGGRANAAKPGRRPRR